MATEKKYLDLAGLQHLKDQKVLVKHPTNNAADPAAVKVGTDVNGHVVLGSAIGPADIGAVPTERKVNNKSLTADITLGVSDISGAVPNTRTIAGIDLKDNITKDELRNQLGITGAMHFAGTTLTALTDGATTNPIKIKQSASDNTGTDYTAITGDVVLYNGKEFILTDSKSSSSAKPYWEILGDEGSHALKSIKISAGSGLTGGGDLSTDRTISHATTTAADASAVKVGRDELGHVVFGAALEINEPAAGKHTHSVTSSIAAEKVVTAISPSTTKLSVSTGNDTFVKSYPGVTSKLVTTSITGVSGSTSASTVSGGTTKDIAKVGTAVVYGTADCGTAVSGIAKVGGQITYGNANVGVAQTVATSVKSATATTTAMKATYDEATECLTFTVGAVTPSVTLNTTSVTPASTSSNTAYVCADGEGVSITPAKAADTTRKITPAVSNGQITGSYTIGSVNVPVADTATTVATGTLASTGSGASILTGLGTAVTASALTSASLASGTTGTSVVTGVTATKGAVSGISGTAAENGEHTHGTAIE